MKNQAFFNDLLDPYRMDVWVANRTDGVSGTGTQNDPFDGSLQAKFDAVMNGIGTYTCVHLGPGTFQTKGYNDATGGAWQPKAGLKLVGSGVDVTVLQLASSSTNNTNYYAIGHALSSSGQPKSLDLFEVSDLTIDCNFTAFTASSVACGAVRVLGNHARIRRLKLINWGSNDATNRPCFVVSAVTATDLVWVEDCGIEECIAVSPAAGGNTGPVTVFHAGAVESPQLTPQNYGVAPYIRNCFVDASPSTLEIRGLSMGWSKAGIIEGNQVHNLTYGVFQQATSTQDLVIRNNWFKNVNKGVLVGNKGAASTNGTLGKTGSVATVTISGGHNLSIGDFALLNTSGAYNGLVVTVLPTSFSSTVFKFNTSNASSSDTVNSVQKVWGWKFGGSGEFCGTWGAHN